jgi:hypothetical protein
VKEPKATPAVEKARLRAIHRENSDEVKCSLRGSGLLIKEVAVQNFYC